MSYKTIVVTDNPPIRTVTLNRPERRNAMTQEMQLELIKVLEDSAADHCGVLMITGAGEAFCSGLDLSELQTLRDKSPIEHRADAERIARLFLALYEVPLPTIAVVNGPAIAGGTGLATLCDFTLATPAARFGYTEVRIGFVPAIVSAFLSLQIGDKQCRDLLLTGRLFGSQEALDLGLVSEIVETTDLMQRATTLANSLLDNSPQSLSATKHLLAAQNRPRLDAAIVAAMEFNAKSRETPDFHEGVTAFLEKRKPAWQRKS